MSQITRRITISVMFSAFVATGAIIQAEAGPQPAGLSQAASPPSRKAPSSEDVASTHAREALLQSFRCATSLMSYQLADVQAACGKTIDLLPESPIGYKFRGYSYLLEHRYERAEFDFREAVRRDPKDPDTQAGYAQSFSGEGRFDEAVERFGIALKLSPHDARYLSARCWARAGGGHHLEAALDDCNLALKLAPSSSVAWDSRGLAYLRKGNNLQAIGDYSQSLKLQSGRATALFGRGIAEWHLGQYPAARADLFLARRVDPEIDDIYIQVGVLAPGCRDNQGPCALPEDLRGKQPQPTPKYLSVSYRIVPRSGPLNADDIQTLRAIELIRTNSQLWKIASLLGVSMPFSRLWQDAGARN
jgi:tetratricopeptide (TPR) repeat protein